MTALVLVESPPSLAASFAFCHAVARREAKNFYPSFLLLPAPRRAAMCALYAYLRRTDDIADGPEAGPDGAAPDAHDRAEALARWRLDLHEALAGHAPPSWPGWPALADVAERYAIPPTYLAEVIDGVAQDLDPQPFATWADLDAYCYRVASVVGLCCLHIWGFRSEGGEAERLAEACGVALQLTNILRDVPEDARMGRVYLPTEDLVRFGVEPRELLAPTASSRLRALLAFEADRAATFYEEAARLAPLVSPEGRPVLLAIVGTYRRLLDEIVRRNYDVFTERVAVSTLRKVAILLRALVGRFWSGRPS